MNDDNIYKAPEAELTSSASVEGYGSLEKGLAGDYSLTIGEVISEAWRLTSGVKGKLWLAVLIYIGITLVMQFVLSLVGGMLMAIDGGGGLLTGLSVAFEQVVSIAILTPLGVGIAFLGIHRAVGLPLQPGSILNYFGLIVKLFLLTLVMYVLVSIGMLLLLIPGIYLAVGYWLAQLVMVDKGLGIWEALEASRKAITHKWFTVFGLGIVVLLINMLGVITIIGWIWTIPLTVITGGIVYRNVFGYQATT